MEHLRLNKNNLKLMEIIMKNKKSVSGILILIILGVVFVSGCVQQEGDGTGNDQNGDGATVPADLTQLTFFEEEEGRAVDPD